LRKENKELLVGIDDATKCPVIGSIFVSTVAAGHSTLRRWKKLGVKDSKLLTRKKRDELAPLIMAEAEDFLVREITPAQIDDKTFNLNQWEMLTVLHMMDQLRVEGTINKVIVDNWEVSAALFETRRQACLVASRSGPGIPGFCFGPEIDTVQFTAEHRADENHVVVGAASILSKVHSDRQYDDYRIMYGDFGSGSPGDPKTRHYVWTHRHHPPPIVRTSWNTYKYLSTLESIDQDFMRSKPSKRKWRSSKGVTK
jgi:ribonuclease HII